MSGQWLVQQVSDSEVHAVPLDDLVVHDFREKCPCGPRPQLIPRNDRPDGWVYTHHSLDGREFSEPDHGGNSDD